MNIKVHNLLENFIIKGGFEIASPNIYKERIEKKLNQNYTKIKKKDDD